MKNYNPSGGVILLIVQKYGGTSVADKKCVMNAANRVADAYKEGNSVVVVVSAQGNTTDELIKYAADINDNASRREMDMLLSTGEQQSASLMAIALNSIGIPAISLNAWQMGIVTTDNYSNARIEAIAAERILKEIADGKVVVAAGFQGINSLGDITTLGRGGSDTTAVALAIALKADKCEIYTDVEGVFTADPRIVPEAEKLKQISYDEMLDYTSMGAKVLHNRSVEMAKKHEMPIAVRSSFEKCEGTVVCGEKSDRIVSGIALDKNIVLITVKDLNGIKEASGIFKAIGQKSICIDTIMSSAGGTGNIMFSICAKDLDAAKRALEKNYDGTFDINEEYSKISVIGIGLETNPGIAAVIFETLEEENIDVKLITTSEIKISLLVEKDCADNVVKILHNKFIG